MSTWPRTRDGLSWGCALAIVFVGIDLLLEIGAARGSLVTHGDHSFAQFVLLCQMIPLAVWMAFGRAPFLVRLGCLSAMGLFWVPEASRRPMYSHSQHNFELLQFAQLMLILPLLCFVLRLVGFEFVQLNRIDSSATQRSSWARSPFLVAQMLAWCVAFLWVGLVSHALVGYDDSIGNDTLIALFTFGFVAAIFLPAGTMRRIGRSMSLVFVIAFFAILTSIGDRNFRPSLVGMSLAVAVPLCLLILYFRLGFRLVTIGDLRPSNTIESIAQVPPAIQAGGPATIDSHSQAGAVPNVWPLGPWSSESAAGDDAPRRWNAAWLEDCIDSLVRIEPLAVLLVVVLAVVDSAGAAMLSDGTHDWGSQQLFVTLLLSQTGIIGVWLALGSLRGLIRLPLAVAAIAALITAWVHMNGMGSPDREFIIAVGFCSMAGIAALVLFIARPIGVRLIRISPEGLPSDEGQARRLQFSMLHVMFATAEIGALAALAKFLHQLGQPPPMEILGAIFQGAILAPLALLAAWVALARPWPTVRLLVAAALLIIAGWGLEKLVGGADANGILWLLECLLVGQLAVFRVCGYHLEFSRRRRVAVVKRVH